MNIKKGNLGAAMKQKNSFYAEQKRGEKERERERDPQFKKNSFYQE